MRALLPLLLLYPAVAADRATEIDAIVSRYHDLGLFNGAALVADHGQIVIKKGYGLANIEWDIPNTPDTKFRLGSITKQFTATLVMQLVEQGKIDLNAPITRYLADYPKQAGDKITIHQLLNHTSGIPGYTELPEWGPKSRTAFKPAEFMTLFSKLDLLFEPGSRFSYNNSGYFLLGVILENVTGQSYERLLQERIFQRAGMQDSGYDSTKPLLTKRAAGYDSTLDGFVNTSYIDMSQPYAAGSLYSTVEDLYRWDQALYGDKLLSEASKQKMFTPGLSNYGYAWFIRKSAITTVEHGGGINGFNTLITRDLEPRRLIVLLNNTGGAPLDRMATAIRAVLDGREPVMPKRPASPVLYRTYQGSGLAVTIEQIHSLQTAANPEYDAGEGELSRLAGHLLSRGKTQDALELAKLIAADTPKSAGAAMLLGNAQRSAGHRVEALQAFARAMELSETPRAFPIMADAIKQLSNLDKKP